MMATKQMSKSQSDSSSAVATGKTTTDPIVGDRSKLESQVKLLLKQHYGSTKNKEVKHAIDELTPHNPTPEPTKSPLLVGDFICHTIPEFPGRIKSEDKSIIQYTLGKLSFGMFQPHNLICTIRSVRQAIRVRLETKSGIFKTYEYPVMMDLTIHRPGGDDDFNTVDLPAIVCHDAICYECPKQPHRMKVKFKGSTLMPSPEVLQNTQLLALWMQTFENAYEKAERERNLLSWTLQRMLTWWFQMTLPSDEEFKSTQDHSVHFEMKRAPRGHLDILYLSDTTRITKGNRGTIVVVEPMTCTVEEGELEGREKAPSEPEEVEEEQKSPL